jgi:hypothetical protein
MHKRIAAILMLGLAAASAGAGPRAARTVRCCLVLPLPDAPQTPVCAQVHRHRRLGPRLACRLLGGTPRGRGDCSLALCAPDVAGG